MTTMYAAPVIPGPAGARRPPARPPALPSRLVWPIDRRVAYELSSPAYRTPRAETR